jgi:hypothetical protein
MLSSFRLAHGKMMPRKAGFGMVFEHLTLRECVQKYLKKRRFKIEVQL